MIFGVHKNTLFIIEAKSTPLTQSKHHDAKSTQRHSRHKEAIPSIDIMLHMWLGFPIHEKIERQKGKTNHEGT